jgi:mono/diheme cytochrome c family protein
MADGHGVPGMQPSLVGSPFLRPDAEARLRLILAQGSEANVDFSGESSLYMPGFAEQLTESETAELILFLRKAFGGSTGAQADAAK